MDKKICPCLEVTSLYPRESKMWSSGQQRNVSSPGVSLQLWVQDVR